MDFRILNLNFTIKRVKINIIDINSLICHVRKEHLTGIFILYFSILLNKFKIDMNESEYNGIRLADGLYNEQNKLL